MAKDKAPEKKIDDEIILRPVPADAEKTGTLADQGFTQEQINNLPAGSYRIENGKAIKNAN
jgi:hypothetical protein